MSDHTRSSGHDEKLEMLLELIGQINSNLDLNKVLMSIINAAKTISNSEACSVFLINELTDELVLTLPTGPAGDSLSGRRFPRNEGIAGWVATHAQPQVVNDVAADSRFRGDFKPRIFRSRNMLCVPLLVRSRKVVGVLQVINKSDGGNFEEDEIPLLQALANQAAVAISNARLYEERETLIGEIHHRVKNNMAVISGMMQLQALDEENEDVKGKLLKGVARVSSMATVHEQLYKSENFSNLDFSDNLKLVVGNTIKTLSPPTRISTEFQCGTVQMNINQAIPCSLLVNEVITLIIKDGFHKMETGILRLELSEPGDVVLLRISDNGSSVGKYYEDATNELSVVQFIGVLTRQIEAEFSYDTDGEFNIFTLKFRKMDKRGTGNNKM